ncbi:hypothetical protein Tco_0875188 [Tanacetum coccineum]|uniref:Transposase (Putative), gypsy type n=1 Tax=Tanacetum coccineum TaxID=301880 RepID=A0ABQ5BRS3_9ASTR
MANFIAKNSIMTQEMVDSFCDSFYILAEVHPTAPGRDKTITQFPVGKVGDALEKDSAHHLISRQEQTVKLLESHKAPFRRYPECFLCLVGLSPYYAFDENFYRAFEHLDGSEMGLFNFIKTADPWKVRAVEVQKGDDQVKLLERQEDVAPKDAYLELADPDKGMTAVIQSEEEVVTKQPRKGKNKSLLKQSDVLPAKKLRMDHHTLVSGTGGKTFASLEHIRPVGFRLPDREQLAFPSVVPSSQESEGFLNSSAQTNLQICTTVESSSTLGISVDTTTANMAGPSQPVESEGYDDFFYEPPTLDPSKAKHCYVPRWNITNDSLLDDGFSYHTLVDHVAPPAFFSAPRTMDYDQLYTEFNIRAARQVCLEAEVAGRERFRDPQVEVQLAEKEVEAAEVIRLRDQVSSLSGEKSTLTAEVSALKVTVTQKDHDISLLNSRATCLASTLDDAKVACAEAGNKITSLASEQDRLASEDFKERMEIQQEEQAQELYNRVAELEAHVMDVFSRMEGEFYPTYLTTLAGRMWLLTHRIQLALLKCLKSPEYQGTLGHALGRAVDFGMQEGLEASYEHGTARRNLSAVDAYNPKVAKASYINAVKALEDVDFPLVNFLMSKKDAGMDELSILIHHAGDKTGVEETSMSFALMNVHARADGAKKYDAALCQLMMEIVSAPLSS